MAMEITNSYNNVYGSAYAEKNKETKPSVSKEVGALKQADKQDSVSTSKAGSIKKISKEEYLSELNKKYSDFEIGEGTFSKNQISAQGKGFQGVMINSAYLAKAQSNEKTAKELDEMLSGVATAQKWLEDAFKRDGLELVSCGYYIDENGNMGSWSVVKKKDSIFDGLTEQSEKDTERIKKKKEEKEKEKQEIEEKKKEEKEIEKRETQGDIIVKSNFAQDKAENLLSKKLENADDGKIYLDNDDMQTIINAAKEEAQKQSDKVKNPVVAGNNFDMQI